jgi:hypothetical protein
MLVGLTGFNILALLELVDLQLNRSLLLGLSHGKALLLLVAAALPQYVLLLYQNKYKLIAKGFACESLSERHVRGIVVSLYIVLSLILPILGAVFRGVRLGTL